MKPEENEQIKNIIGTIEEKKKIIPTFSDLCKDSTFGPLFQKMDTKQQQEIKEVIYEYIQEKLKKITKTKGGQLFSRFVDNNKELFWKFRTLNENDDNTNTEEFQTVGKQIEAEIFKIEGILTEKMINQIKGLDQVLNSFYNIVYLFFPRYNSID